MLLIKKVLIGFMSIMMFGCSVVGGRYDSNEYTAFAVVNMIATDVKKSCGNTNNTQSNSERLLTAAKYANVFTKYQPYNQEMHKISTELLSLVTEFDKNTKHEMTKTYCEIKIDSIIAVSEIALQTAVVKGM